jgi:hypothetical protein
MIRFLALKLINEDQSAITKIGNVVLSSSNRIRLLTRLTGTAVIAVSTALLSTLPHAIILLIVYFEGTQNCGYNCDAYFEELPKEVPVKIYQEQATGHPIITQKNKANQVEIYLPTKLPNEILYSDRAEKIVKRSYKLSGKKAKEVKFSEFAKTDPVLSQFKDLLEPDIPQKSCSIDDIHDIIDIRID